MATAASGTGRRRRSSSRTFSGQWRLTADRSARQAAPKWHSIGRDISYRKRQWWLPSGTAGYLRSRDRSTASPSRCGAAYPGRPDWCDLDTWPDRVRDASRSHAHRADRLKGPRLRSATWMAARRFHRRHPARWIKRARWRRYGRSALADVGSAAGLVTGLARYGTTSCSRTWRASRRSPSLSRFPVLLTPSWTPLEWCRQVGGGARDAMATASRSHRKPEA